jgi:predicted site-specific integrase-resolvase
LSKGGHRRYSETTLRQFLGKPLPPPPNGRKVILHPCVSSWAQKGDLENQVQALKQFCIGAGQPYDDVWTNIGSGLNYRRSYLEWTQELAEDLFAIVQHFCVRFHRKRSYNGLISGYKCRQAVELARQTVCLLEEED